MRIGLPLAVAKPWLTLLLDVEVETIVLLRTDSSNQNRVLPCWDVESDSLLGLVYLETFYRLKSLAQSANTYISDDLQSQESACQ